MMASLLMKRGMWVARWFEGPEMFGTLVASDRETAARYLHMRTGFWLGLGRAPKTEPAEIEAIRRRDSGPESETPTAAELDRRTLLAYVDVLLPGLDDARAESDELRRERGALQAEVQRLTTTRRVGEESAYALAAANNDEARREAARADVLQAQLAESRLLREGLRATCDALQSGLDQLRADMNELGAWHTTALRSNADLSRTRGDARHLLAWQQARGLERLAGSESHQAQLVKLKAKVRALRVELEEARTQRGEQRARALTVESVLRQTQTERDTLRAQVERLTTARDAALAQVERLREALIHLRDSAQLGPTPDLRSVADAALSETGGER